MPEERSKEELEADYRAAVAQQDEEGKARLKAVADAEKTDKERGDA